MLNSKFCYWRRLLGTVVLGYVVSGPMTWRASAQINPPVTVTGPVGVPTGPVIVVNGNHSVTLSERLVWPHLRFQVKAAGDRLVVKGKERATLLGSVSRGTANSAVRIVSEISGNLRYEEQGSGGMRVLGSDTQTAWLGGGTPSLADTDLLETILNDSAEHFLVGQMTGLPTRFYGANFRMDDGKNPNYTGPYYDVYEVGDKVLEPSGSVRRTKVYCLNSQSLLLERVHYKLKRGPSTVRVEVLLGNWKQFQDQQFPTTIARTEDGKTVFTVLISSAVVTPSAADGIFAPGR
jgi:hypothetical protein